MPVRSHRDLRYQEVYALASPLNRLLIYVPNADPQLLGEMLQQLESLLRSLIIIDESVLKISEFCRRCCCWSSQTSSLHRGCEAWILFGHFYQNGICRSPLQLHAQLQNVRGLKQVIVQESRSMLEKAEGPEIEIEDVDCWMI